MFFVTLKVFNNFPSSISSKSSSLNPSCALKKSILFTTKGCFKICEQLGLSIGLTFNKNLIISEISLEYLLLILPYCPLITFW